MLILGIDPGTARLGFGVIESSKNGHGPVMKFIAAGCLETTLETPMPERLLFLQGEVGKVIAKYRPDILAIEQLFFGINAKTAIAVGQARGVVLAEAARHKVPVVEYQGLTVKFTLTGFGRSKKKEIQESVRQHLGMEKIIKPDDAADGVAIAMTHHFKQFPKKEVKKAKAKK